MSRLDRRHFLCSAATVAALGSVAGVTAHRRTLPDAAWEWTDDDSAFSSVTSARCVDDGSLLVGTARDESGESQGFALKLDSEGNLEWSRRYVSPDQQDALEQEVIGPIPQDGLAFALEAGSGGPEDGYLLVGWTYFDNTAVYIARLVRIDPAGAVLWERSFADLEDASAYSFLANGVRTDDGYLLCGIESPGIMLGGAGWVVSVDEDGDVDWHRRYPATDRNLEETSRQDVFRAITETPGGYALAGHFDPEDESPGTAERAWVVGIDEDGDVHWDDRFALETPGSTRAYDVLVRGDCGESELAVVGAAGPNVPRGQRLFGQPFDPVIDGDGFLASYTDAGEQTALETLPETPLFDALEYGDDLVAGGARENRGWVGTAERTFFEDDRSSVVTSVCETAAGDLLAAGRRTDDERTEAFARLVSALETDDEEPTDEVPTEKRERADDPDPDPEPDEPDEPDEPEPDPDDPDPDPDPTVEFLDCETVRVVGEFDDVILDLIWWSEAGQLGTITEPVGPVSGERTISATEEFGQFTYGPIVTSVELFEDIEVATPGFGDTLETNPNQQACEADILALLETDGIDDPEALG
ncbi:hypothetical protein [Natronobiforma cellulositropha]|uniref:hypothetical protein n=1 Tax=Natronobiforma cellulositropha TaxID=1679076 RepID=UPI0021D5CCAA|nr:hypothetical protein [Natronobiforma cellulositropha]